MASVTLTIEEDLLKKIDLPGDDAGKIQTWWLSIFYVTGRLICRDAPLWQASLKRPSWTWLSRKGSLYSFNGPFYAGGPLRRSGHPGPSHEAWKVSFHPVY